MDRRHYQNIMGNIEQLLHPWSPITFFKYDWLFEKHLTKSQNLMLYTTSGKFSWLMANNCLTHGFYTTLSSLDSVVKKWDKFLHKKRSKNLRFRPTHILYNNFLSIDSKEKSRVVITSLGIKDTNKKLWETLNVSFTQEVLLHFLNKTDFLRNIWRNRKTWCYIPLLANFLASWPTIA